MKIEEQFDGTFQDSDIEKEPTQKLISLNQKNKLISIKKKNKKNLEYNKLIFNVSGQLHLSDTQYPLIKFIGKKIFKWQLNYDKQTFQWDLMWTDNAVNSQTLAKMQSHQKINHFPGMFCLARKNHLGRNLIKMKKKYTKEYNFFPITWILPSQYNQLKMYMENKPKGKVRTLIVKPEASSQGKETLQIGERYVVQRYIHKPLLIDNLKFDLRIYVLLTGCQPLRVYVYKEGLARFATKQYMGPRPENLNELCMHLTNYAINKQNPDYIFNQNIERHKRSLSSLFQSIKQKGHDIEVIKTKIYDIIIKTLISGQPILSHHYMASQSQNYANDMCFQILGFDILIDHQLNPHLLQVNHTPSFTTDTPLDSFIKKGLIKDSFTILNINYKRKVPSFISYKLQITKRRK